MKRASYRKAVSIIAMTHQPLDMNPVTIAELISVSLTAEIFGLTVDRVVQDVREFRDEEIGIEVTAENMHFKPAAWLDSKSRKCCPCCYIHKTYSGSICPKCEVHFKVLPNGKIERKKK